MSSSYKSSKIELLMAKFSNLAYKNIRKFKDGTSLFKNRELQDWKYVQLKDAHIDMKNKAFLAVNNKSQEIVIVFKGSEPLPSFDLENIVNDWWIADLNLVVGVIPKQFYDSLDFLNTVKKYIDQNGFKDNYKVYMTGHSLGGSVVQLLCSFEENSFINGYTYNAYGVKHLLKTLENKGVNINQNFSNINNFSVSADLVSNQNEHIGNIYVVKYNKNFVQTLVAIVFELPKVLVDIPYKIKKSIKYYLNCVKWTFIKINGHLMNNFISEFNYEKYNNNLRR